MMQVYERWGKTHRRTQWTDAQEAFLETSWGLWSDEEFARRVSEIGPDRSAAACEAHAELLGIRRRDNRGRKRGKRRD